MQQLSSKINLSSPWLWLGIGLALVLLRGLFIDVMDVDASQYASIAREMLGNGSWLQVQHRGADYLDKPPLLFWLSTASFEIFGVSNWAYKLPSLLAAIGGVWGVYRFALLFYGFKTARQAAFMLASSLGLIIICNDVRTDTLLLGATTCAIWQLAEYLESTRWRYLLGGFFCIGLAMLAKGPIGLVVPGFAVGTHLLLSGRWRDIFKWQWLAGLVVTALVLAPMCWGLWQQFDLHPEKLVNGRTGVSGLYFYFWEQSFGRVTGENVWRNDASGFYFLHVYLWAFLPWCLLLLPTLGRVVGQTLGKLQTSRGLVTPLRETYSAGAFVLTFIAMSMSQYKLPHYIFITLPWAAVLVAQYLNGVEGRRGRWVALYISVFAGLFIAYLLPGFVFPTLNPGIWLPLLAGTALLLFRTIKNPFPVDTDTLVQRGVLASVLIGFVLNFHFYPNLLPFQSSKSVAEFARKNDIPASKIAFFHRGSHALDFYNGDNLEDYEEVADVRKEVLTNGPFWLHADDAGKGELELNKIPFVVEHTFPHFQVALLKPRFLDPAQRTAILDTVYLLKVVGGE